MREVKPFRVFTEKEILAITKLWLDGTPYMREICIEVNLSLVNRISGFFTKRFPYRKDDIFAEGYSALVEAVDSINQDHDNPIGYIAKSVSGRIRMYICKDQLVTIPYVEFTKRLKEHGEELFEDTNLINLTHHKIVVRHDEGVIKHIATYVTLSNTFVSENLIEQAKEPESMESLYIKLELTKSEVQIINYLIEGYTQVEIAEILDCSQQRVSQLIAAIRIKIADKGLKYVVRFKSGDKECNRCKELKSLSEYYKIGEDKYKSICKDCMKQERMSHEQAACIY